MKYILIILILSACVQDPEPPPTVKPGTYRAIATIEDAYSIRYNLALVSNYYTLEVSENSSGTWQGFYLETGTWEHRGDELCFYGDVGDNDPCSRVFDVAPNLFKLDYEDDEMEMLTGESYAVFVKVGE